MTERSMKEYQWITQHGHKALCIMAVLDGMESHRCGYVGVPAGHPLYKVAYTDCVKDSETLESLIDIHGGVTFTDFIEDFDEWFIGFDCAHLGDKTAFWEDGVLRSKGYVIQECESLSEQIAKLEEDLS